MKSLGKRVFSAALACVLLVSATLSASAANVSDMTDIPSGSWYESAVRYCLNNGYMNGESETKFNPNGTVSRAQMVQVLYNLEGQPDTLPVTHLLKTSLPAPGTTTLFVGVKKTVSPAAPARRPSSPTLPLPGSRSLRSSQITPSSRTTIPALRAI